MERIRRFAADKRAMAILMVAYLSFVWGTTYIAVKIAIKTVPIFMMTGMRELLAGFLMLILAYVLEKPGRYSWSVLLRNGAFGLGFFTATRGMMALSLDYIDSGLVALIYSLIPVYVLFLNAFTGQFFINRQIIWGMALGALGMFLVFHESLRDIFSMGHMIGIGVALLGSFSWAGTSVLVSGRKENMPPLLRSAVQLLFGSAGLWAISFAGGETVAFLQIEWNAILAIVYLAIFGSVAAFLAFMFAIKHLPVARATLYAYINPFVTLILGWLILSEPLSPELVGSFFVTLAGVYLVNRGYRKQKY